MTMKKILLASGLILTAVATHIIVDTIKKSKINKEKMKDKTWAIGPI